MNDSDKKRFAASAQNNREPILVCLKGLLTGEERVLEIGSGTGQHACYFASHFPDIVWQPTELAENIPVINQWLRDEGLANIEAPVLLDVSQLPWSVEHADVVYTCNTFHIMSEACVECLFAGAAEVLEEGGRLIVYGPFIIDGKPMVARPDVTSAECFTRYQGYTMAEYTCRRQWFFRSQLAGDAIQQHAGCLV